MKNNYILFFTLLAFSFSYTQNDLCENAIPITPTTTCNYITGTFSGSSISSAAPSCTPNSLQDVWYSFLATDPTMSVGLQANSSVNHAFEIFQGSCTGTSLVCINNNSASFGEFYANNNFVVGQTYYVRVLNASGNLTTANFSICVQNYPTPANDLCSNVISITQATSCNYVTGTFSGSSISSAAPSCTPNSLQDVWYSFLATDPTMSVDLQANSSVNHAFEIFQGSCTGTSLVCINNNSASFGEFYANNNFVVGQTYYVRVLNTSGNLTTANFSICVQNYPTPANDLCSNAISITPTTTCNYVTGTFSGSSISSAAPSCTPNSLQDVWYSFVATDPTMSVGLQANSSVNHAFEIFQGSCSGTSLVCINNNSASFGEFYANNNFVVGQTYYVRVLNASGNLTTANFSICVENPTLSTNEFEKLSYILYPNPAKNYIMIKSISFSEYFSYSIYDLEGKKVLEGKINSTEKINIEKLSAGTYMIKCLSEVGLSNTSKFIKI